MVAGWTPFRGIWFGFNNGDLQSSEMSKVSEVANSINQNSSLQLGIDGSVEQTGSEARDQNLSNRRLDTIRNALVQAGVPAYRIQTGAFGDPQLTRATSESRC